MYFKLGDYRVLERDIKYIKWVQQPNNDWSARICFRDGEELSILFISDAEKNKIEEWWDKDIEKAMSYFYYANTKEEEK